MAQFDVYKNCNAATNKQIPYLLDIQNDIFQHFNSRVVIPLVRDNNLIKNLNPQFVVNGEEFMLSTAELASVSSSALGDKVMSLEEYKSEIIYALDFLITGF